MMKPLLIAILVGLVSCTTANAPPESPPQVNVFAENVELIGESVNAVEETLVCGSDLAREWFFEPIGRALASIVPFFAQADPICND